MYLKVCMHMRGPRLISRYLIIDNWSDPSPQLSWLSTVHQACSAMSCMLLTKCTLIAVIRYCYYTVIGRVATSARCHVSRAATFTRVKVILHFTRELTKELGHRTTDRPTDRSTPTVTSYPIQNPNTYHPNVWGKKNMIYGYSLNEMPK